MEIRDVIRSSLARLRPRRLDPGHARQAAVLILVFEHRGTPHFLLTRRTQEVRTHKGQISFPGGMQNDGENLEETAMRETFEEVGIERAGIEMLGRFHDYLSITGYLVASFAGYIHSPFSTATQNAEVAEVLQVPLDVFRDPSRLRTERMMRSGRVMDVFFYRYESHEIWGLTAHIIKDFLAALCPEAEDRNIIP